MPYFKFTNTVDGDEDPVYVDAADEASARSIFSEKIGELPSSMLKVEAVGELPDDEEPLTA